MSRNVGGSLAFDTAARTVSVMTTTDYGPQTPQVLALIERCKKMTEQEALQLATAWDATWDATRDATRATAWDAARDATRATAWDAARGATWDATWDATRATAWDATWDATRATAWDATWGAALALVASDLISTEHYDTLTRPWRVVIGPIHPDDPEAALDAAGLLAWQGLARSMPEQPLSLIHEIAAECMARP